MPTKIPSMPTAEELAQRNSNGKSNKDTGTSISSKAGTEYDGDLGRRRLRFDRMDVGTWGGLGTLDLEAPIISDLPMVVMLQQKGYGPILAAVELN